MVRKNTAKAREFVDSCRRRPGLVEQKKQYFLRYPHKRLSARLPCAQRPPPEVIATDYVTFDLHPAW
jgi:hypothetical protein